MTGAGRRAGASVAMVLAIAAVANAHDTWILPAHPAVAAGSLLSLEATSGMAFPAIEFAIAPERLSAARVRLAGTIRDVAGISAGKRSLRLSARPDGEGIACVWLETKPKPLELRSAQVREYLQEIGADESIEKTWASRPNARWREVYAKHAKTFVAVGAAGDDRSWETPVGMRLEIVPLSDPTRVRAGDRVAVRLLREGRPAAGFPLGIVQAGEKTGILRKTDAAGRVVFDAVRPGWILLRVTELRPSSTPDRDWESDFSTLTLPVR